jgi:hypothetical protein
MIEHHREVMAWLESIGADAPQLVVGGKHGKILFDWQGRRRSAVVSLSPSSRYATDMVISQIRHDLGLVGGAKTVGRRRAHRKRSKTVVLVHRPLAIAFPDDLRTQLERHPAGVASLRYRLDRAWLAYWRELIASVGGRSYI